MNVPVVRVYVTEGRHVRERIFRLLHDVEKVRGLTVYRGSSGFGKSGRTHSSAFTGYVGANRVLRCSGKDRGDAVFLSTMVEPGDVLTYSAELFLTLH